MANIIQNIKNDKIYDYIIVGGGLVGLLIANHLSRSNQNVLVVEALEHMGGSNKKVSNSYGDFNNGLRWLPYHSSSDRLLDFLASSLNTDRELLVDETNHNEEPILTYENSQLKPFLGFKDLAPDYYEELSYFLHPKSYFLKRQPQQWIEDLTENLKADVLLKSYVTRFNLSQDTKETIESLIVNGNKTIKGKNFIFSGLIKDLGLLLSDDVLSLKAKAKLNKNTYWQSVCLDLVHNKIISEANGLFLLNGTTQDDIGPCIGAFLKPQNHNEQPIQASQWMTFIDQDDAEESENIANSLKKIKKQIKRAFPDSFENILSERIFISPAIGGHGDIKLNSNQTLAKTNNLWIASPTVSLQKNLWGAVAQAQLVLSSLGCETNTGFADVVSESTAEVSAEPTI